MRLATIKYEREEIAAIVTPEGLLPVRFLQSIGKDFPDTLFEIIESGQLDDLRHWWDNEGREKVKQWAEKLVSYESAQYAPLYRRPHKIWGIGLNYVEHAEDLHESAPRTEPASFMKPDTAIIGHGDTIDIPRQSHRTTAEAELGVIIGKRCKEIKEEEAINYIAGYTTIIDMTTEDILQINARYLTRSKSFDTFFSFGPQFVTPDEVEDVLSLRVATFKNSKLHRLNVISNMTFKPFWLVAFHSHVMTMLPGDIISTGTPGAAIIQHGDVVECHITGFEPLVNPVRDLKLIK